MGVAAESGHKGGWKRVMAVRRSLTQHSGFVQAARKILSPLDAAPPGRQDPQLPSGIPHRGGFLTVLMKPSLAGMWRVLCAGHHGAASGSNPLTEKY